MYQFTKNICLNKILTHIHSLKFANYIGIVKINQCMQCIRGIWYY